jgi:hypothetical protein
MSILTLNKNVPKKDDQFTTLQVWHPTAKPHSSYFMPFPKWHGIQTLRLLFFLSSHAWKTLVRFREKSIKSDQFNCKEKYYLEKGSNLSGMAPVPSLRGFAQLRALAHNSSSYKPQHRLLISNMSSCLIKHFFMFELLNTTTEAYRKNGCHVERFDNATVFLVTMKSRHLNECYVCIPHVYFWYKAIFPRSAR